MQVWVQALPKLRREPHRAKQAPAAIQGSSDQRPRESIEDEAFALTRGRCAQRQ